MLLGQASTKITLPLAKWPTLIEIVPYCGDRKGPFPFFSIVAYDKKPPSVSLAWPVPGVKRNWGSAACCHIDHAGMEAMIHVASGFLRLDP